MLCLEVPVANILRVKVLYGRSYLAKIQLGFNFVELGSLDDLVKQLAPLIQLQHDEEVVRGVDPTSKLMMQG